MCHHRRVPERVSTCELEADGVAEDILNRGERLRVPLESAAPNARLVESLGLMWEEERHRCGGHDPPPPPPDPPRDPQPLCAAVDYVRAQFQACFVAKTKIDLLIFCALTCTGFHSHLAS